MEIFCLPYEMHVHLLAFLSTFVQLCPYFGISSHICTLYPLFGIYVHICIIMSTFWYFCPHFDNSWTLWTWHALTYVSYR